MDYLEHIAPLDIPNLFDKIVNFSSKSFHERKKIRKGWMKQEDKLEDFKL